MSRHRYGTLLRSLCHRQPSRVRFGYLAGRLGGPLAPEDMALRINCLGAEGRYGISELAMETENYFRLGLERITQSDGAKLLVFYCLRDCWMSWNAAKRALALGYKNVAWYPDGRRLGDRGTAVARGKA